MAESLSVEEYLSLVRQPAPRRRGRSEPPPAEPDAAPGVVICSGVIEGRAVPWKAPHTSRRGGCVPTRDYKRYTTWLGTVRAGAKRLMGRKRPYGGPVEMEVTYYLAPRPGTLPDTSNLTKAFEDALQGVVYRNDGQVCRVVAARVVTSEEPERVEFVVRAHYSYGSKS